MCHVPLAIYDVGGLVVTETRRFVSHHPPTYVATGKDIFLPGQFIHDFPERHRPPYDSLASFESTNKNDDSTAASAFAFSRRVVPAPVSDILRGLGALGKVP